MLSRAGATSARTRAPPVSRVRSLPVSRTREPLIWTVSDKNAASRRRLHNRLIFRGMPPVHWKSARTLPRQTTAGRSIPHAAGDARCRLRVSSELRGPRWHDAMTRCRSCSIAGDSSCLRSSGWPTRKLCNSAWLPSWKFDSMRSSSMASRPRFCASSTISNARFPSAATAVKKRLEAGQQLRLAATGRGDPEGRQNRLQAVPPIRAACSAPGPPRPRRGRCHRAASAPAWSCPRRSRP